MHKNRPFLNKLQFALSGWLHAWRAETNFRRHVWLGVVVLLGFALAQPPLVWWALAMLCIGLMLAFELANTAVEELVDLISPEYRIAAGRIKDLMAGAVLAAALAAVSVGACVLWVLLAKILGKGA